MLRNLRAESIDDLHCHPISLSGIAYYSAPYFVCTFNQMYFDVVLFRASHASSEPSSNLIVFVLYVFSQKLQIIVRLFI
jgi:hypothetical protein